MDGAGIAPAVFLRHGFTDRCLHYSAHPSIAAPAGFEPTLSESNSDILPLDEEAMLTPARLELSVCGLRGRCSAIHFPLSGRVRNFHPLERAHGAQTTKNLGNYAEVHIPLII